MRWLLASAVLLAIGMIVAGVIAGGTLRERDEAVRDGLLTRTGHDLERDLREGDPGGAQEVLQRFALRSDVGAIELRVNDRLLASAGSARIGKPFELPLFLGPNWRGVAGGMGMGRGGGRPPFRALLWPAPGIGDSSKIAAVATWGSIAAALALLAFAAVAARGITAQQRAAALDAEHRRLELVSAAGAGLAHRIRNPLATIKGTAQVLVAQASDGERERAMRIVDASVRIETLVDDLLRFARPIEVNAEDLDLGETARLVVDRVDAPAEVRVHADREHVLSAIEELVANARALDPGHEPEVAVRHHGRYGTIEVRDRGPGLQLDAERAFEPYVTTRANGTGLGLPAIRGLVRANGGDVTLANRSGGGCVATILLPAASA